MTLSDLSTQADAYYLVLEQARESLIKVAGLHVQQSARSKALALANLLQKLQARLSSLGVGSVGRHG